MYNLPIELYIAIQMYNLPIELYIAIQICRNCTKGAGKGGFFPHSKQKYDSIFTNKNLKDYKF